MKRTFVLLALLLGLGPVAEGDEPERLAPDRDGIEVTTDTVLAAGTWTVATRDGNGVLCIRTDGVTLDLGGATLRGAPEAAAPDSLTGVGILVENAKGVTIKNGHVAGFKVGIRAMKAPGLRIQGVNASGNFKQRLKSTPEREDAGDWLWPHHNDEGEWESRYGAGISLNDCEKAAVHDCTVRHGQNGLLLTRCRECYAYDNDFSFNSGWGIALYRTTHSEVSHNRCDFCVRGYSHGVYFRGQDSAGILVFEQCSHNRFVRNSATHSGDGFFLYAGHETTQRTGEGGSNDNRVSGNDFRFAVANGIEATFSRGNVFDGNDCSGSDHGVWAGYSYRSRFCDNRIHDCMSAGVSIEHGHDNQIARNRIRGARYGVHLWWDNDTQFLESVYGRKQDCSSSRNDVSFNTLQGTTAALRLWNDQDARVEHNRFQPGATTLHLGRASAPKTFEGNAFDGDLLVMNETEQPIQLDGTNAVAGKLRYEGWVVTMAAHRAASLVDSPFLPPPAKVRGSRDTSYPKVLPAGRDQMRIDEWGPVDPRETRLFPATQTAGRPTTKVHLLGSKPFRVVETSEGVAVRPEKGTAPATLTVHAVDAGSALRSFRVVVESDGRKHVATGTLLSMPWYVKHFTWTEATDPLTKPEAFAALLAGEPKVSKRVPGLDFPWQGGGPEGVPHDRFATLATSEATLPKGRYLIRVVSDDGVRVFVDGKQVIERWTHHGPTEDVAEVELKAGKHTFRIEHFEIDGWSYLTFRLAPTPP